MVRFDVSKLRGKTIDRAELIFRARVVLDENDSSVCTRKPIAKMMILNQQFRAGMGGGWIDGGADTSSPVGVLTGGQIKTDVTHLVTRWANGDLRNHGVVFIGRDESPFHSNNKCVVRMSDFKLDVDYHD